MSGNRNADGSGGFGGGGSIAGGARPQTAEIIKTFNQRCSGVTITNNVQKADFAVILDHEGGKGLVRRRNKIAVFNRDGDVIFSDSTRELGNSVKDACQAILSAPPRPQQTASPPTPQTQPAAAQSVAPANSTSVSQNASDASIEITSTPSGADIELDGNFVGNTPSTIGASLGVHTISIKKNGYKLWERKIKVSSGKVNISAELEAEVKPTASVEGPVDTPKAPDEPTQKTEVAVVSAGSTAQAPARVPVQDTVGTVSVTSDPSGADIYADDSFVGKTPTTFKLIPGKHFIRVFAKDYKNWSQEVAVEAGAESRLTATLEKSN